MNKTDNRALVKDIIECCINSSYTGMLKINFNNGSICKPVFKTYKKKIEAGKHTKISTLIPNKNTNCTITISGGSKEKFDITEQVWLSERE